MDGPQKKEPKQQKNKRRKEASRTIVIPILGAGFVPGIGVARPPGGRRRCRCRRCFRVTRVAHPPRGPQLRQRGVAIALKQDGESGMKPYYHVNICQDHG